MTTVDRDGRDALCLAQLEAPLREQAMARFAVLRPHLEDGVPLARAAGDAGVAVRTAQRWLARYRACGLAGLARTSRVDTGRRRIPAELAGLIEGLALRKPRPTVAAIHRRALAAAQQHGWPALSYGTVYAIVRALDPAMVTLAQEGQPAFRDRFELAWRHRASRPNALWQADHTELDVLVLDADGTAARPWLTVSSTITPARSPGTRCSSAPRPRCTPRWRSGRRSGARPTRPGRSAASPTCSSRPRQRLHQHPP